MLLKYKGFHCLNKVGAMQNQVVMFPSTNNIYCILLRLSTVYCDNKGYLKDVRCTEIIRDTCMGKGC